jgi:hypothetical protein
VIEWSVPKGGLGARIGSKAVERGGREEPIGASEHERRLHTRAYDLWASLLKGGRIPAQGDLDPAAMAGFAGQGVLIGLDGGGELSYIGEALRDEAGLACDSAGLGEIPAGSMLALLIARVPAMRAAAAPYGFETVQDANLCRGMLLPFADEDGAVAAALGVIGWKQMPVPVPAPVIGDGGLSRTPPRSTTPWGDGPGAAIGGGNPDDHH